MGEEKRTIGEILKQTREEQELSLEQIAVQTRVNLKYLAAVEADQYEVLPSQVQIKGFVRSYAMVLNLDPDPLLIRLRKLLVEEGFVEPEDPQPIPKSEPITDQPLGEIGSILQTQREKLGYTIENVEGQTYIPKRYLEAIEKGGLEELPSTVQGKGMVKNYAQFLGLDPDPLLLNYADVLHKRLNASRANESDPRTRSTIKASLRRFLASPTILWVGVVLLIGFVTIWSAWLIFGNREAGPDSTATIPGVADILLPSSTPTPTQADELPSSDDIEIDISVTPDLVDSEEGALQPSPTIGFAGNEKVQVQLIVVQRAWVRVSVDNIVVFEGRLLPGSVKIFGGELNIEVLTGNAGGVEVIFNQRDYGAMGLYGEAINRVYTSEGIVTPTPTITPTPIHSETPEATPAPPTTDIP
jgi:cytoskeleton protein RodZ